MAHPLRHHLLGLFVAFHVGVVALGALPAPTAALNKSSWQDPVVAAELDGWFGTLRGLGMQRDREVFEDDLYDLAVGIVQFRRQLLAPAQPYFRTVGTTQGWQMFVAPMTRPATLRVEARWPRSTQWEPLYVHQSPEHRWHAEQLTYSRVRPLTFRLAWPHYRRPFQRFANHLATQAAEDFPDLMEVRVFWERRQTPAPGAKGPIATPKRERTQVFTITEASR